VQVKSRSGWVDPPPIPGTFVCNIGDMLDRLTHGIYRSTPHRVINMSKRTRLSFPFFFDPNFDAQIVPIEGLEHQAPDDFRERWDQTSVHQFSGTYGDYLLGKVSKGVPGIAQRSVVAITSRPGDDDWVVLRSSDGDPAVSDFTVPHAQPPTV
jgi:isopenicillin N synthase-like dioxygenase